MMKHVLMIPTDVSAAGMSVQAESLFQGSGNECGVSILQIGFLL